MCGIRLTGAWYSGIAQSTLDVSRKHKQMEHAVANGSVHTGRKQQELPANLRGLGNYDNNKRRMTHSSRLLHFQPRGLKFLT